MVAGQDVVPRLLTSAAIGPWMVTLIGTSLAKSGVGGDGALAVAFEAMAAAASAKIHPFISPLLRFQGDRGTVCGIILSPIISSQLSGPP